MIKKDIKDTAELKDIIIDIIVNVVLETS